ncbi:6701_t:CDS:1, partial [Rhizophagus irregularis]
MSQRPLITSQIDNTIKELVKDLDNHPNLCENISEKINKQYATNFTLKQIRQ